MKKSIQFIINPKSGGKSKNKVPQLIEKYLDKEKFDFKISLTNSEKETKQLAELSVANNINTIVAVGGDGTINNIAKYVKNSNTVLGIIPFGSGNGFARELNLFGSIQNSIQIINKQNIKQVDTGMVNEHFFCNLGGVGFDAHVGGLFAESTTRGFQTYIKITLNEYIKYKPKLYKIKTSNANLESVEAFMICVCNGPQFGNDAFIAPQAKLDDGIFDITIVKPFPFWKTPAIAVTLFSKSNKIHSFLERIKSNEFTIFRENEDMVNIDGEPIKMGKELSFKMNPKSLKVLVP
jgi:YegS/Rv2252/BmrU family lipid kinase